MSQFIKTGTGSSNIDVVIDFGGAGSQNDIELEEIKFHLSTAATAANDLVIKQRSKVGAAYDTVLLTQAMSGVQDIVYLPSRPVKLNGKDRLAIIWTNDAASFKTWAYQARFNG